MVVVVLRIHPSEFLLEDSGSEFTLEFAERHDEQVFKCLTKSAPDRDAASTQPRGRHLALTLGVSGLGNAQTTRDAAHRVSWADSLEMIRARHPDVCQQGGEGCATWSSMCLGSVADSAERLKTVGARIPSWEALARGVRQGTRRLKDRETNEPHHG